MFTGKNLKADPGGKSYKDSDWSLKTNERAVAKDMPLLSGYANYGDWETDDERWAMTLYNHPVSSGVDYFANNLNGHETSEIDVGAGGFLKNKAKSKIGESGEAILKVEAYDQISYEWALKVLRGMCREPEGCI